MNSASQTIAAVASANATGAIGVVRASGPQVSALAQTLLGRAAKPRHAHWCRFVDSAGEAIDQGLLLLFPAPHSYTGEDVLELQGHGNPLLLQRLLERLLELGARRARPGEFTERAFLNGKMDLIQAEAVADLIASGSAAAARAALRSLDGEFSQRVRALTEAVIRLRMWI
ncbi:MAG: tRNA uridine-5-carboxymethylaminomethyl(34) synthesis GTPase MnmE, partial [Xanthomonadales bacterium]|nr:tRNA uridine-5-carboxymethylaminomethyl(34) synthesis GTPase MnmE [Xanthomonadales bacterium]